MKKISILLPFKENFSPRYAGAASLLVNDTVLYSKYRKSTTVYGSTDFKEKFYTNYKNINFDYILNVINNNKGRIKIDSREIKPGDIFLTLKGNKEHGNNYIGDALAKKANYIISEKKLYR